MYSIDKYRIKLAKLVNNQVHNCMMNHTIDIGGYIKGVQSTDYKALYCDNLLYNDLVDYEQWLSRSK